MNCSEAVYSEDYYDFILSVTEIEPKYISEECIQEINQDIRVLYYPREGLPELNIQDYTYPAIPKCFTLLDEQAMEVSGILKIQNQSALSLKGQGTLIGFVDTGIDYKNKVFRNSDGTTRILRIWDQTRLFNPPEGFLYGSEYTKEEIDNALRMDNPDEIVPQKDTNGHGTFLAGIAAGSEVPEADFIGAAPFSQIVMVKLKEAKQSLKDFFFIPPGAAAYQENDIMAGVAYLVGIAERYNRPMVICIGLGSNSGDHSGNNVLAQYLDYLSVRKKTTVVIGAGNEVNARHHFYGEVSPEKNIDTIEINVEENTSGFFVEIWAKAPELYTISVISPTGERVPRFQGRRGAREEYRFIFEGTRLSIDYQIVGIATGDQLIYAAFENPTRGIWTIEVEGTYNIKGIYNVWLPISGLIAGDITFIRSNPDQTITVPGNARIPITTAAYNAVNNTIYGNSSRGYTVDGYVKPDLAAPGVEVYGPEPGNRFGMKTGSSVAAAIMSGAAALYLEWAVVRGNNTRITAAELKNDFIRGANRTIERIYPNKEWGYGTLDIYQTFEMLRRT